MFRMTILPTLVAHVKDKSAKASVIDPNDDNYSPALIISQSFGEIPVSFAIPHNILPSKVSPTPSSLETLLVKNFENMMKEIEKNNQRMMTKSNQRMMKQEQDETKKNEKFDKVFHT